MAVKKKRATRKTAAKKVDVNKLVSEVEKAAHKAHESWGKEVHKALSAAERQVASLTKKKTALRNRVARARAKVARAKTAAAKAEARAAHLAQAAERKTVDEAHKLARESLARLKQAGKSFKVIDTARAKAILAAEKAATAKPKRRRRRARKAA